MSNYPDGLNARNFDAAYHYGTNARTSDAAADLDFQLDELIGWLDTGAIGALFKNEMTFVGWTLEELDSDEVYDVIAHPIIDALSEDDGDDKDEVDSVWDEKLGQVEAALAGALKRYGPDYVVAVERGVGV